MLSAAVLASALGAATAAAAEGGSMLEEVLDPRLFIITNTSNTNVAQYVLGAIGVVVVLGLLLALVLFAAGFFGSNAGALNRYDYYQPDTYSTYPGQTINYNPQPQGFQQGFQARSLGTTYNALNILMMLEEAFQKLDVVDFDCQQRVLCEAHETNAIEQYGDAALRLQKIIGSADANATEGAADEVKTAFETFRAAAVKGAQQESCARTFAAKCAKGLRDLIAKKY